MLLCATILLTPLATLPAGSESASGRGGEDLTIVPGSYGITPYPPRLYDVLTVNFTVINMGTDPVLTPFTVAFYLNNTTTPLNRAGNTVRINQLGVGQTANVSCTWDTQTSEYAVYYSGVEYGIIVVVDSQNTVSESDETNNNLTVMQSLGPERLPDLELVSFSIEPPSPVKGDEVLVNVTVTNVGETAAKYFKTYLFDGEITNLITEAYVHMINVSQTVNATLVWNTSGYTLGPHTILIFINPAFYYTRIPELDWSNNNASIEVLLRPPELHLELLSLELYPESPHKGDVLQINLTLRNNGTRPAEEFPVVLRLDGSELYNHSHNLGPMEELPLLVEVDTSPFSEGEHCLTLAAGNIERSLTLTLLPMLLADLVILNASCLPELPLVGQSVVFTAEVVNSGEALSLPCSLSLYLDYDFTPVESTEVPALQPDELRKLILTWNTSGVLAAIHRMRLMVDSGGVVAESNESNNYYTWMMEFRGEMDLALESLSIRPERPRAGERVEFSVTVVNVGSLRCPSANLTLRVGGLEQDRKELLPLAPGGRLGYVLLWSTTGAVPGVYDYEIRVEPGEGALDVAPLDNVLNGSVELHPPEPGPDLSVRSIEFSPGAPRVGEELVITVSVENTGNLEANASSLMVIFESGGAALRFTESPVAFPAVPAGGAVPVAVRGDTSKFRAGTYVVNVTVDYNNFIDELNESNNYLTRELVLLETLPASPALKIEAVFFEGKLEEGKWVNVIARLVNRGDGEARGVTVRLLVDEKEVASRNIGLMAPGANLTVSLPWRPSGGKHTVLVRVDSEGGQPIYSSPRQVSASLPPTSLDPYLIAAALCLIILLVAMVAVYAMRTKRPKGPNVRLVDEEE
ncbi:MAG: CARDB domain-containing protein [Thermoplasmata archaeon]